MEHAISVKGIGNVSLKPDEIIIDIDVVSKDYEYDETMKLATSSISELENAIEEVGFNKTDLKTTRFNVTTSYKGYYDKDNVYQKEFDGYICEQSLKLEFDLDMDLLEDVINSIANSNVNPKLNIRFSVKDKDAVNEKLLIEATNNARRKAEILAKASRISLGKLVSINYNMDNISLYSNTTYAIENKNLMTGQAYSPNIVPDDIKLSDTVEFVWQIK